MIKLNFVGLLLVVLILAGCAALQPKFDNNYLSDASPDNPKVKISFKMDVNDNIIKYNSKSRYANNIELYWLDAQNIYLYLENSAVYSINTTTNAVSMLEDGEKDEIVARIMKRVFITNTAEKSGFLKKATSYLLSTFGQQYTGELVDKENIFQIYAALVMQRGNDSSEKSCESATLSAKLTNDKGKEMNIVWPYPCDWTPQPIANNKVPQILRRLYTSPSGQYVLDKSKLYRYGAQKAKTDLILNYPNVVSITVKPDWKSIAILRESHNKYWIELFDLKNLN